MKNKNKYLISIALSVVFVATTNSSAVNRISKAPVKTVSNVSFPDSISCDVKPHYRFRTDGKAGREVIVQFKGKKFLGKASFLVDCNGLTETTVLEAKDSLSQYSLLLPVEAGVKSDCQAKISLLSGQNKLQKNVLVSAMRQWTVYVYPHSHVDIGYTNTQANVEIIHKRNLINGIELAKKTANYPKDSRYLWNPEVLWPVERYLNSATPEQRSNIVDAVQKGYLHLDAGYIHANTSSSADEELFEYFRHSKALEKLTNTKIETLVQVDIPGMSWGVVPVAAKLGVKYCFAMNNGSDRVGLSTKLSFKPFWWMSQDGKSKILFLQPGNYTPGAAAKGFAYWPKMAGQTDPEKLIQIVKTDQPREHFIDAYLAEKLPELQKADYYPYDIFAMSWAMADNMPIDADLPDAVKSWNEEYAFPHLVIASATQIMRTFEEKYGNQLPVLRGDFTEYWTDGLGTAAKQTGMNRSSKERLIQSETLWTLLQPDKNVPRSAFNDAWRDITMGTEHTWCYMNPKKQPINNNILKVKFDFFENAEKKSKSLVTEAFSSVVDSSSSILSVFNTLSWSRSGLVYVPEKQGKLNNSVFDENGKAVLAQRLSNGQLVFMATDVPSLGSKTYSLRTSKKSFKGTFVQGTTLNNGLVELKIDPQTGDISKLSLGNKDFAEYSVNGGLNSYRYLLGKQKETASGPQYAAATEKKEVKGPIEKIKASEPTEVKVSIKENGPLISSLLVESKADGCNWLTREVAVIAGQSQVEITNTIDKIAIAKKEGVHFGFAFNVPNPVTRVDIPWGIMELEKDQLAEGNRNWIAFQRWLDVSNNNQGVTFCSLDAPVFESGDMTANIIGSATNSPEWIEKLKPSATIYSWALNNHWHTNFPLKQEGIIQFRYRLLPHSTQYNAVASNRFGMEQVQPLLACPVKSVVVSQPPLKVEGSPNIVLSVLKSNGDGKSVMVRLRSISDKDELVKLNWSNRVPKSIFIGESENALVLKNTNDALLVPAMGFTTINAIW